MEKKSYRLNIKFNYQVLPVYWVLFSAQWSSKRHQFKKLVFHNFRNEYIRSGGAI